MPSILEMSKWNIEEVVRRLVEIQAAADGDCHFSHANGLEILLLAQRAAELAVKFEMFHAEVMAGCDIQKGDKLYRQFPVVIGPGKIQAELNVETLQERVIGLVSAFEPLIKDVEKTARDSFATSAETFENDFFIEDPNGFTAWKLAKNKLEVLKNAANNS